MHLFHCSSFINFYNIPSYHDFITSLCMKGVLYNMEYIITSLKWLQSAIEHI